MRYVFSCVMILTATGVLPAVAAEARECDVIQLVVDHPDRYEDWMVRHAEKPAASTGVTIKGRVAEGETILITTLLPAVGDVFFAATADCQIPVVPDLEMFDIEADADFGNDPGRLQIELGPLTPEMFGTNGRMSAPTTGGS